MKKFIKCNDLINFDLCVNEIVHSKKNKIKEFDNHNGKVLGLIFFNPSLRTRLSTQKAAMNLGMKTICMNIKDEGWQLEFDDNVIMNSDKAEHIREAAKVLSTYCDIIGIRSFANLSDKKSDLEDKVINSFVKHSTVPIINLESALSHPLQSLADAVTIKEMTRVKKPKIVLTWAPHPKALPHAVANSFIEMCKLCNFDLTIANPLGYNLDKKITNGYKIVHEQNDAFKNADFIYAKNWSCFEDYGKVNIYDNSWTIDENKMSLTNKGFFMHCLPVRRNMIVTDSVLESKNNISIDQARNRTHATQFILKKLLKNEN
jgi:N-succinyl-L-ornithine transcarbamylase